RPSRFPPRPRKSPSHPLSRSQWRDATCPPSSRIGNQMRSPSNSRTKGDSMKSQRVTTHPRNIATAVAASATIAAFLAGCSGGQDDPAAVVQEWISAVQDGDYEQACLMVAEDESTPLTEDSDDFGECTTAFEMLAQEG